MPILLVCPSCGKRLQVGDQYAGRKVACPGCKTVITAPAAGAAPPPPPPAPKPAAAPLPPPPEPEREPADDPFSFGSARRDEPAEDEDEPKPPAKKPGIVGSVGGTPAKYKDEPKPKKRPRDDDDEDDAPKPRRTARGRREEPKSASAKAWAGFGTGSALAKWGMWIEFFGFAIGVGLIAYLILSEIEGRGGLRKAVEDFGGPVILAPFLLSSFVGTLLVWLGRARMMGIPRGTGAKKVFLGAFLLTLIRLFAVAGAAVLLMMAASEWKTDPSGAAGRTALALLIWMIGVPFWALADLSTIPAMAIAGGAIPSLALRRRAGWVAFVLQLIVIGYVLVALIAYFGGEGLSLSDLRGGEPTTTTVRPVPGGRPGTPVRVPADSHSDIPEKAKTAVAASAGILIFLQFVYTALYAGLYGAGARAARDAREAEEAAEDEDV